MLFDGDERSVYQENRVTINQEKWTGTLILTNKRLVLERVQVKKSHIPIVGKDQKNEIISFITPLSEVMKVEVVKKRIGKPISFKISHSGRETMFTVNDPNVWQNQILKAKSEVGMHPFGTQPAPAQPYGINVNIAAPPPQQAVQQATSTQTIERQVIKIRCSYCGSLYDEVESKCPACGARR